MKPLRWLWKQTAFGMSNEQFEELRLRKSCGPDFDRWIKGWNFDVWCIGIIPLTIILFKLLI